VATRKRDLFVNSIGMVPVGDRHVVPTAVWYSRDSFRAGDEAYLAATEARDVFDNFKILLGEQEHGSSNPKSVKLSDGRYHSIHSVASDYLRYLVDQAEAWIESRGLAKASRVIVAEPVSIHEQGAGRGDWLINYRTHIRRILESRFSDVDFLPEPFAVFQYYRYGIKHPLVAEKKKHVALVLDFGGGTFDVSIIETTAAGDVSNSGRNSKPLAASSIAVGGFYFNRIIAEYVLLKQYAGKKVPAFIHEALRKFDEVRKDPRSRVEDLREDYQHFHRHFSNMLFEVEKAKIAICSIVTNWSLDYVPARPIASTIKVPAAPLSESTEIHSIRIDETEIRNIFVEKIWKKSLSPVITSALQRANGELAGQNISVVLLSGGSANLRWLRQLLLECSHKGLADADVLELHENFQEIVGKGLAIECARKTFNDGDGDFKAVTYNRLCLVLNPDRRGEEIVKFRPVNLDGAENHANGVLLPSASILRNRIDNPIRWKFKLNHPPRQRMNYHFMSSSFDPSEHANVHNVMDNTIITPSNPSFDSALHVQLDVKADGTAQPTFIYRASGPGIPEIAVEGRPFFIDMTFGGAAGTSEAYLGLDFGTSNSSISYVDKSTITVYTERAKDTNWESINELINSLPYPIASPLAQYAASTATQELDLRGIAVIEGFLAFGAFVAYSEYTAIKGRASSKLFKDFTQRSAGPLWGLLKNCLSKIQGKSHFCQGLEKLLDNPIYTEINELVTAIGQVKHEKAENAPDYMRAIRLLGNVFRDFCGKIQFGYFEDVHKKRFSSIYQGNFRMAFGAHTPFVDVLNYEGADTFSEDQCVLLCPETGKALLLEPLMFWFKGDPHSPNSDSDLFFYDIEEKSGFSFKRVGAKGKILLTNENFGPLIDYLKKIKEQDPSTEILENISILE
jgi:molecular chaperone DnaK (HSP70)